LRRGREERLAQAAGGLTFTMVMSMVPLLAVSFALFARTPALHATGDAIREHLLRGLLPAGIAKTVLKHLAQFAGNANGLTLVGFAVLLVSALALLLSMENTLNRIWQVKKPRPVLRRLACMLACCSPARCSSAPACGLRRIWWRPPAGWRARGLPGCRMPLTWGRPF
jgi:membrane protein